MHIILAKDAWDPDLVEMRVLTAEDAWAQDLGCYVALPKSLPVVELSKLHALWFVCINLGYRYDILHTFIS